MTIGEKVRNLRKDKGLTQEAVASALEVSRQAIAKWECDQSSPSTENLLKLANLFDVSLEELVDVKQYQTTTLEEYVRRKLEEEQKQEETKTTVYKKIKEVAIISAAYTVVYVMSWFAFHMAGIKSCIWSWMTTYHILSITCGVSVITIILNRRIASGSLLIGSIAAIFIANSAGAVDIQNSPIGYNNGWVFYLTTLFISYTVGYLIEFKVVGPKIRAMQKWRKAVGMVFVVALSITFIGSAFLSVRHVKYGKGAENGYKEGYAAGAADAQSGNPMNQNLSADHFPAHYTFGSTEFKGYAIYWPQGYKCGYSNVKG